MYQDNKDMVEKHNREFADVKQSFKMTLNKFADLTEKELTVPQLDLQIYRGTMKVRRKPFVSQ